MASFPWKKEKYRDWRVFLDGKWCFGFHPDWIWLEFSWTLRRIPAPQKTALSYVAQKIWLVGFDFDIKKVCPNHLPASSMKETQQTWENLNLADQVINRSWDPGDLTLNPVKSRRSTHTLGSAL